MADPELPLPIEVPWKLASTTQSLAAGGPDETSISAFYFEPSDEVFTSQFPDERLVYLKFTVSVSPATIPNAPPVAALGEGAPCLHLVMDLKVRTKSGELGTIRPYFHSAAPAHRSMLQTGVVGADAFEGEADMQAMGRSGSQMFESSSTRARTTSASLSVGGGYGPFSASASIRTTSTDVNASRAVSQQIDTTQRQASQERRELVSHMTHVENVLTLLNAKYVGTPYLRFSLSPQPLQLLSLDPSDPNLWFSQLLTRRSSGIEGLQEFTTIVLVPKGEDFCVTASLRRVCVLDSPPGPLTFDQRFQFNQHLVRVLEYLERIYPPGTPLGELDVDVTPSLPDPKSDFAQPVIDTWVISAAGYMGVDVVSPKPGPSPVNLARGFVAYKHFLELWLDTLRDEYERKVAQSPIERGVLLGETRTLDTCFAFSQNGLGVSGSTSSLAPLARIVVDRGALDIGGVHSSAGDARANVRERAFETATRWNLLENRLAVLLANRKTLPTKKIDFADDDLLALVLRRWSTLQAGDPQNLSLDQAVTALGLTAAHRRTLESAGINDLRSIAQLLLSGPAAEGYNDRLDQLRRTLKAEKSKVILPEAAPLAVTSSDLDGIRKLVGTALAKNTSPEDKE
jgi:hypothetical protein